MTKVLLLLSLIAMLVGAAFNTGLLGAHDVDALYAVFPTGASFFGLFLIVRVLEKESTRYDDEQRKMHSALHKIRVK